MQRVAGKVDITGLRAVARLTQDGKTLELTVTAPADARLVVSDAVGRQSYDAANPGVRILAAQAGATVEYKITLDP